MKKRIVSLICLLALCAGCSPGPDTPEEDVLHILATTYPVYLLTTAVTAGTEGVEVDRLVTDEVSCLHDYTLTVTDMKTIERADIVIINGAGLEDFMDDALVQSDAPVIDCSEGIELLPAQGHEGHHHETEYDPHYWMDPRQAAVMVQTITDRLSEQDPGRSGAYSSNAAKALELLGGAENATEYLTAAVTGGSSHLSDFCSCTELITFHDGFQYFARAFGLDLLKAIEEEEGAETSAAEVKEIVTLVQEYSIPAIFTEKNGPDATARAIAQETGCQVYELDMMMSGEGEGITAYIEVITQNLKTILDALGGE